MGIERTLLSQNKDYALHFNEVKTWFEENMPNFFDSIEVDTSSAASSYYNRGAKINFYQNEKIIKQFVTSKASSSSDDGRYTRLQVVSAIGGGTYTTYMGTQSPSDYISTCRIGCPEYYNFIYEIIKLTENAVAFSLCNNYELDSEYRRPGIIIFIKTHKNRIATIHPEIGYSIESPVQTIHNNSSGKFRNHIQVLTENTYQKYELGIEYNAHGFTKTGFTQLPVCGDMEDYPVYTYALITSSTLLKSNSDVVLHIGMREYYYNGVIAIEI